MLRQRTDPGLALGGKAGREIAVFDITKRSIYEDGCDLTGMTTLDLDKVATNQLELGFAIEKCLRVPYVMAVWPSASNKGLKVLCWTHAPDLFSHAAGIPDLAEDFEERTSYQADPDALQAGQPCYLHFAPLTVSKEPTQCFLMAKVNVLSATEVHKGLKTIPLGATFRVRQYARAGIDQRLSLLVMGASDGDTYGKEPAKSARIVMQMANLLPLDEQISIEARLLSALYEGEWQQPESIVDEARTRAEFMREDYFRKIVTKALDYVYQTREVFIGHQRLELSLEAGYAPTNGRIEALFGNLIDLCLNPHGCTWVSTKELAGHHGVDEQTIRNYFKSLSTDGKIRTFWRSVYMPKEDRTKCMRCIEVIGLKFIVETHPRLPVWSFDPTNQPDRVTLEVESLPNIWGYNNPPKGLATNGRQRE